MNLHNQRNRFEATFNKKILGGVIFVFKKCMTTIYDRKRKKKKRKISNLSNNLNCKISLINLSQNLEKSKSYKSLIILEYIFINSFKNILSL
jgi:hypothetical protein